MTSFRLSPAAQGDLGSIWDYSVAQFGEHQTEIYLREIQAALERIAENPQRGRAIDEVRDGYRRYAIGSHLIFFVERDDGIDVIRILHQRMDHLRHL